MHPAEQRSSVSIRDNILQCAFGGESPKMPFKSSKNRRWFLLGGFLLVIGASAPLYVYLENRTHTELDDFYQTMAVDSPEIIVRQGIYAVGHGPTLDEAAVSLAQNVLRETPYAELQYQ